MLSLSRNRLSPEEGDGGGVARRPWMRGRLAPPALSWWGRILDTGMTTTGMGDSTAAFTAVAVMRAVGFNDDTKGASRLRTPRYFWPADADSY